MQDISTYLEYRKYNNSVRDFRNQIRTEDFSYQNSPKNKSLSEEELSVARKRGEMLKRVVDGLDEYSQTRMEKVETVTQTLLGQSTILLGLIGGGAGKLFQQTQWGKKLDAGIAKKLGGLSSHASKVVPGFVGLAFAIIANIPFLFSLTRVEIQTARIARAEAFKKTLSHPNDFAILSDEQEKQAKELSAVTKLPPEESESRGLLNGLNVFNQMRSYMDVLTARALYKKENEDYEKNLAYKSSKISTVKVDEKELKKAKESRDILQRLVSKVDFDSQDYIQKVFILVDASEICLFGFGVIGFWILEKLKNVGATLIGKTKPQIGDVAKTSPYGKFASGLLSLVGVLFLNSQLAEYRNDAIRIARHKKMNELLQNPANFLNKPEALKSENIAKNKEEKDKIGLFSFLKQFLKDRKEYIKYLETQGVENEKFRFAARKLKLSPEQLKEAKLNKDNIQKMVHKLDLNKKHFEENFEIFVELVSSPIGLLAAAFGDLMGLVLHHIKKAPESHKSFYSIVGTLVGLIPAVATEIYTTFEVRRAARVSYSEAHKQMSDEKDFLDYSLIKPEEQYLKLAFKKN